MRVTPDRIRPFFFAVFVFVMHLPGYSSDSAIMVFRKNVVFATFGGNENFGSVNYEHLFSSGKKLNWSYSIGVQPFQLSKQFSLPVSLNTFTAGRAHHLELDLTATFFIDKYHPYNGGWKDDYNKKLYLSPFICYRYQKSMGIIFKTGIGPQILLDPPSTDFVKFKTEILQPSLFASLGISF